MNVIRLLPVGEIDGRLLNSLGQSLSREFSARAEISETRLDPNFSYNAQRQQFYSTEILARMQPMRQPSDWRFVGVASVDLFIPILTFVFGEAQLNNPCALVSTHRLHQEFYGLPADEALLTERLIKEGVHEVGHTLGLVHCIDYSCAMASSHGVEWIDLKGASLCRNCRSRVRQAAPR
jgi:archaemetzincin